MTAINAWGSSGNAAFALPMTQAEPSLPNTQGYVLCWNTNTLALEYMPVTIDPVTGSVTLANTANLNIATGKGVWVAGKQVVSDRNTGWVAPTGITSKATFDPATVTLAQLGQFVAAMYAALAAHGLVGA